MPMTLLRGRKILTISDRRSESDRVNTGFHRSSQVPAGGEPLVKHIENQCQALHRQHQGHMRHEKSRMPLLLRLDTRTYGDEVDSYDYLQPNAPKISTKLPIPEGSFKASHACLLHREI